MSAGRSRRSGHEEEHENHERWAVSYADMMTVLLATFIVLYAMSAIDQEKFEELRQSLALGFGHEAASIIEGSDGAMLGLDSFEIAPDFTSVTTDPAAGGGGPTQHDESGAEGESFLAAAREYEQLSDIRKQLKERLAAKGLDANVTFQIDERGLVVGLVGSNVYFAADTADLTPIALRVVDTLAGPLRTDGRMLSIEGHANLIPSSNFASNWELSSARATEVLRRFVESGKLEPAHVSATGFGDSRPLVEGDSSRAMTANRRVDVVVRSDAAEEVRALLPDIVRALEDGTLTEKEIRARLAAATTEEEASL